MDHRYTRFARPLLPAIIGLSLGVAMSMMYAPFSDDSCETFLSRQDPQQLVHMRGTKSLKSQEEESFEPRIIPPMKQSSDNDEVGGASKAKLIRPRYASTELGIREKLFVGVVTSKNTINTLGVALNKTLSNYVTRLVYFLDDKGPAVPSGMTIVNFKDNHPHLIPVHMLKYVSEQYLDTFDYYMFVTDHTYVRGERLFNLVSHISVSQHVHMGAVKTTEAGKAFCHLDGGIILSQSLMEQVRAHMEWCLAKCHHNDQSLNFGKCLIHATDMACTDHGGAKKYKAYQVKSFTFDTISKLSLIPEFNSSHSVFPMPDDTSHYKLHRYFCEYELNTTQQEIERMKENIFYMSQYAPGGVDSISWPIGVPEPYKPKNRFDVIRWDYFTETLIYLQDDFTNIKLLKGADKLDIQEVVKVSVERLNAKYNNIFLYSGLKNGYRRFDPQRGMEYVLDITMRDTSSGNQEVQKRVQLVRPLGQVEIVPMPYVTETTTIHLILPVGEEDREGVGTFLDDYGHICLDAQENTELLVMFIYQHVPQPGQEDIFSVLKSMITYYNKKYADSAAKIEWISLQSNGSYISEFYLMEAVTHKIPPDSLVLFCSVGMELATDFFNRVRMNTIPEWQVFFPIGFWQYKPNLIYDKKPYPTTIELNNKVGHYDMMSYEHSSFYISDFISARQLMLPDDIGNGDLFDMFIKYSKLHVFRAVEPALKHHYKHFNCQANSPPAHYQRCLDRRSHSLATRAQLAKLIFEHQDRLTAAIHK
ncbi:chondroitin sulfate synthase 2-like [Babylonia areolata]|uniref:chondroitin sulfate synthase 2-like n=1 Tax=Babylonia areolata TaxID=304850 RepID=UPI003FD38168